MYKIHLRILCFIFINKIQNKKNKENFLIKLLKFSIIIIQKILLLWETCIQNKKLLKFSCRNQYRSHKKTSKKLSIFYLPKMKKAHQKKKSLKSKKC